MKTNKHPDEAPSPRRRRKSHRLYAFLVIALGLAIIVMAVLLLFHVQKIKVEGNTYCTDGEILESVQNDKFSTNTLYVFGKYLLGAGEQPACLESMKVSLGNPWTLRVKVKEKQIVGYLYDGQEYAYFDRDGLVVKKDTTYVEGVPRVEGLEVKEIVKYKPLKSEDSPIFEEILEASNELKKYSLSTEKIVCKDSRLYLYIGKICVSLGSSVTPEKIAQIPPIVEELGKKEGTLHLETYSEEQKTITFNKGEFPEEN